MKNLIFSSLLILLASCAASSTSTPAPATTPEPEIKLESKNPAVEAPEAPTSSTLKKKASACTCVKLYMPVCGENKKTYGNSCEADCAGVKYTSGECKKNK